MKKCIISLGINSKSCKGHPKEIWQDFPRGIKRIQEQLKRFGFDGDFIGWDRSYPPGSPPYSEVFGAAKPFCFIEAQKRGYELVLWVDASAYFRCSPKPLFDIIQKRGYLIVEELHSIGKYCSDAALRTLNITREESLTMPSCLSAVVGLNLKVGKCQRLLFEWQDKATDGITFLGAKWSGVRGYPVTVSKDPRVKGHRYDQTALSVIAFRLGLRKWLLKKDLLKYLFLDRDYVRKYEE